MTVKLWWFGIALSFTVVALVLQIIFSNVTVRRLRKNSETKDALGAEFFSGMDALNVVRALCFSRSRNREARKGMASFLVADADLIYKHTSKKERVFGRVLATAYLVACGSLALLVLFDQFSWLD